MAKKSIISVLRENIHTDQISKKRDGTFIFRKGYFYTHGARVSQYAERIATKVKELGYTVEVVDSGDHWAPFKGGAGVAANSHFFVILKITE